MTRTAGLLKFDNSPLIGRFASSSRLHRLHTLLQFRQINTGRQHRPLSGAPPTRVGHIIRQFAIHARTRTKLVSVSQIFQPSDPLTTTGYGSLRKLVDSLSINCLGIRKYCCWLLSVRADTLLFSTVNPRDECWASQRSTIWLLCGSAHRYTLRSSHRGSLLRADAIALLLACLA